jgi:hypothetical protein
MIKALLAVTGILTIMTGILVVKWFPATMLFAVFTKWVTG